MARSPTVIGEPQEPQSARPIGPPAWTVMPCMIRQECGPGGFFAILRAFMRKRVLFAKGICMGVADVIPGVSGGTLALILGIYPDFIEAIKSINARPVPPLLRWLFGGFKRERWEEAKAALVAMHWGFLIPLVSGIALAIAGGSMVIPALMESQPEIMRGLFFGLIAASLVAPLRMMPKSGAGMTLVAVLVGAAFAVAGYLVTDPNVRVDTTSTWVTYAGGEATLKEITRLEPTSLTTEQVYWSERNAAMRAAIDPAKAAELEALHAAALPGDKHALKSRAAPYDGVVVPAGAPVQLPRPSMGFIFVAGAIAICAMVLPGISGAFLLVVLGCYYFVLNVLKGTLSQLAHGSFPQTSLIYLALFIAGIVAGITSFSRVLSVLLRRQRLLTMAALMGLMIGCLRSVWPYQAMAEGRLVNRWPAAWGGGEWAALGAVAAGIVIVAVLAVAGKRCGGSAV